MDKMHKHDRADIIFVNRLFAGGFTPLSSAADGLGGIELTTIQLVRALTDKGMKVALVNRGNRQEVVDGITTYALDQLPYITSDVTVSSNDAAPFTLGRRSKPIFWMHNPLRIEKAIRKRQFLALLKTRPHGVYVGNALARRQWLFPYFRSRKVIGHGLADAFQYRHRNPPAPIAIWSSQPQRGLSRVLRIWMERIAPIVPNAKLMVFSTPPSGTGYSADQLGQSGVIFMPRVSQAELAAHLSQARVMIYPGYEDETFCSAAAEAICSGVPVITEGTGALRERVTHGRTGILCKGDQALAAWAIRLLTDDRLWQDMQPFLEAESRQLGWGTIADEWISHIDSLN